MPITTLLLDGDGVLQYQAHGWVERMLRLTGCRDWSEVNAVETPYAVGGDPRDAYAAGFPRRTASVEEILTAWNDAIVDVVALQLLDEVRARGVRCYLASNQQVVRAAWMRTLPLRDHLDGLFFSCDLGVAKPDAAFFERVLAEVGADASETLFVDDLPGNVEAARSVGLLAEHKERPVGAWALRAILEAHGLTAAKH